ncbi:amino acid/peptide transporter domain protein [[Clostridium] sordellii ATCC 9714]|nr:amino acid/peptide transporter domain protein [[Clostridium] sordellii ATCC 9714] [Paeniclostridium sordellii ATCC 9714]
MVCAALLFLDAIWFVVGGKLTFGEVGKKPFKVDEVTETSGKKVEKVEDDPLTKKKN